jgi:hypothetical protein
MRPYVCRDGGLYHLFYERYPAFRLPLAVVPGLGWSSSATGTSRSALSVRRSRDGRRWDYAHDEPIVAPTRGWRARFVYACDVRRAPSGRWYLYFNGRDQAPMLAGREAIGFVVADPA